MCPAVVGRERALALSGAPAGPPRPWKPKLRSQRRWGCSAGTPTTSLVAYMEFVLVPISSTGNKLRSQTRWGCSGETPTTSVAAYMEFVLCR
jgi:hypothetical protein